MIIRDTLVKCYRGLDYEDMKIEEMMNKRPLFKYFTQFRAAKERINLLYQDEDKQKKAKMKYRSDNSKPKFELDMNRVYTGMSINFAKGFCMNEEQIYEAINCRLYTKRKNETF
jgi:hypothetical protein